MDSANWKLHYTLDLDVIKCINNLNDQNNVYAALQSSDRYIITGG